MRYNHERPGYLPEMTLGDRWAKLRFLGFLFAGAIVLTCFGYRGKRRNSSP